MKVWSVPLFVFLGLASGAVYAQSECGLFSGSRRSNCEKLFHSGIDHAALSYTLKYFAANQGRLADSSCVKGGLRWARGGIRNQCQFVLNDVNHHWRGMAYRSNAYFIDLCRGTVKNFYMNMGTGSGSSYRDVDGARSTLLGAFLTENVVQRFNPYRYSAAYRSLDRKIGGLIKVNLIGLMSTNNDSYTSKPMHVSPYRSSWGCPSVGPESVSIIRALAGNGPSLIMTYGPSRLMPKSGGACNSAPAPGHIMPPPTAKRIQKRKTVYETRYRKTTYHGKQQARKKHRRHSSRRVMVKHRNEPRRIYYLPDSIRTSK